MNTEPKHIDFNGYRYWYEYKLARHKVDICLATTNPEEYCNGVFLYSDKDPGSGMEFVVVKTNDPTLTIPPPSEPVGNPDEPHQS
jgi:hypothetical protein